MFLIPHRACFVGVHTYSSLWTCRSLGCSEDTMAASGCAHSVSLSGDRTLQHISHGGEISPNGRVWTLSWCATLFWWGKTSDLKISCVYKKMSEALLGQQVLQPGRVTAATMGSCWLMRVTSIAAARTVLLTYRGQGWLKPAHVAH